MFPPVSHYAIKLPRRVNILQGGERSIFFGRQESGRAPRDAAQISKYLHLINRRRAHTPVSVASGTGCDRNVVSDEYNLHAALGNHVRESGRSPSLLRECVATLWRRTRTDFYFLRIRHVPPSCFHRASLIYELWNYDCSRFECLEFFFVFYSLFTLFTFTFICYSYIEFYDYLQLGYICRLDPFVNSSSSKKNSRVNDPLMIHVCDKKTHTPSSIDETTKQSSLAITMKQHSSINQQPPGNLRDYIR